MTSTAIDIAAEASESRGTGITLSGVTKDFGLAKPAALNGHQFLTADLLMRPLRLEQDQLYAPEGPGLGIEVDEQKLAELVERSRSQAAR